MCSEYTKFVRKVAVLVFSVREKGQLWHLAASQCTEHPTVLGLGLLLGLGKEVNQRCCVDHNKMYASKL